MINPTYHALLIANAKFDEDPHNLPELAGPRNDPVILSQALCDEEFGLFGQDNIRIVHEGKDSEVRAEIESLLADASSRDTILLYYSGHGRRGLHGQLYLCASNTRSDRLHSSAVGSNWIGEVIDGSAAAVTIIVLDCCHSGAFKGGDAAERLSGQGRFVLASSRAAELARDAGTRNGASLFTAALVEGLRGDARDSDGDGLVSLDDLYSYVYGRLRSGGKQIPYKRFDGVGNPPIARRAPGGSTEAAAAFRDALSQSKLHVSPLEIDLGDVEVGEHLPVERVGVSNWGGHSLGWTAQASEPWVRVDADDDGLSLHLTPTTGARRANVYVRDRLTHEVKTIRIKVRVLDPMPQRPPGTAAKDGTAAAWSDDLEDRLARLLAQLMRHLPDDTGDQIADLRHAANSVSHAGPDLEDPMTRPWPGGRDIEESELVLGAELGAGGQGRVIRVEGPRPGFVYKRYYGPVNPEALKSLVNLPATLSPRDRERLGQQTAWPLARVLSDGTISGILMRELPAKFIGRTAAGDRQREVQYLLYEPRPLWGDIVPLNADGRVAMAHQCAAMLQFLHAQSLVVGDVSMRNLLWAPGDPPGIFLTDCDGARLLGSRPVLPQAETPDWGDPQRPPAGLDLDTDRYKLALLIGRVLSRNPYVRPGQDLSILPRIPARVAAGVRSLWAQAALPYGSRPEAWRWVEALGERGHAAHSPARPEPHAGRMVLPFYLVCDESSAMAGAPIDAINASLPELHAEIGSNPVVADKTQFCLIGFSDEAEVLQPLVDLSTVTSVPKFSAFGGASYGPVFDLLYETITRDVAELEAKGQQVLRPAVFFLSGSPPDDSWIGSFERITDPSWRPHPNIVAFGFGTADETIIRQIATVSGFIGDGIIGPAQAMREYAQSLIRSIVTSRATPAEHVIPLSDQEWLGFTGISPDDFV